MHITVYPPVKHTFVDFLHDLKAFDPEDVGLLNLALSSQGMACLHSLEGGLEPPARASLVYSLSRLHQIIYVAESHVGRAIIGFLSDFPSAGVRFNHSMPVKAAKPPFDLSRNDPRPVGPELKHVLTGIRDPRETRVLWWNLLERLKIRRTD